MIGDHWVATSWLSMRKVRSDGRHHGCRSRSRLTMMRTRRTVAILSTISFLRCRCIIGPWRDSQGLCLDYLSLLSAIISPYEHELFPSAVLRVLPPNCLRILRSTRNPASNPPLGRTIMHPEGRAILHLPKALSPTGNGDHERCFPICRRGLPPQGADTGN